MPTTAAAMVASAPTAMFISPVSMTMVMPMAIMPVIAAELMMFMMLLTVQNLGARMLNNANTITAANSNRYLVAPMSTFPFSTVF